MKRNEAISLIESLENLLESERDALLEGRLDALPRLTEDKGNLVRSIDESELTDATQLKAVHSKTERNQLLLNSAMNGIREVADRVSELRKVNRGLNVYDKTGQLTRYGIVRDSNLEKKA